jgi:ATP-dependent Zn protease
MSNGDEDYRGVAYHEAGHAVVMLALHLEVGRVFIREDHSGETEPADPDAAGHLPLVDRIAICVAGMNAARMFDAPPSHDLANAGDHGKVIELLKDVDDATACELRQKSHQRAWDLLKTHARSVEDIATKLMAERKIDLIGYVLKP